MTVQSRFPAGDPVEVQTLIEDLLVEPVDGPLVVGDDRVRDFLVALGRRLLAPTVSRRYPELGALGFFLRRGEIDRALRGLGDASGVLRFPRGTVFHVPPANVDTIFVYS